MVAAAAAAAAADGRGGGSGLASSAKLLSDDSDGDYGLGMQARRRCKMPQPNVDPVNAEIPVFWPDDLLSLLATGPAARFARQRACVSCAVLQCKLKRMLPLARSRTLGGSTTFA
jgi:hypothetical protein